MRQIIISTLSISILFLASCSNPSKHSMEWEEQRTSGELELKQGILAFENNSVLYKQKGEIVLSVKFGDEVVIAVADKPEKWGYFQFPRISQMLNGTLVAKWNMARDDVHNYGKDHHMVAVSYDKGKTWKLSDEKLMDGEGIELPNGDRIQTYTPQAIDVKNIQLPEPVGSLKESYGRTFVYYKLNELPDSLKAIYFKRLKKGNKNWDIERASLNDSSFLRYSDSGMLPIVWWGDIHVMSDKSLIAGIYPSNYEDGEGNIKASGVSFYRSTDDGHSWNIQGKIPYTYDLEFDPNGKKRLSLGFGFTEPAFEILADSSFICVSRTTDALGISPMYISRSVDFGKTWTTPKAFTYNGSKPRLLQLDNGVTILSSGRPGVQLRFSRDGEAKEWTDPFDLLPLNNEDKDVNASSCGYTGLLPIDKNSFLVIYSDFKHKTESGETRKAIKVRKIEVVKNKKL